MTTGAWHLDPCSCFGRSACDCCKGDDWPARAAEVVFATRHLPPHTLTLADRRNTSPEKAAGRILVLSVSGGNVTCTISCLPEELFGSSGLEPCPESDHSFSVLAEPVRRIAFHTKVDDAFDRAFNRSAADRHLVPA
jgi:hypothetical protein